MYKRLLFAFFTVLIVLLVPVDYAYAKQEETTAAEEETKATVGIVGQFSDAKSLEKIDPKKIILEGKSGGVSVSDDVFSGLKDFTARLNLSMKKVAIGIAFVMVVFCFAYMIITGNAQERAEQKAKVLRLCIYVWVACSYVTFLDIVIDIAKSFR